MTDVSLKQGYRVAKKGGSMEIRGQGRGAYKYNKFTRYIWRILKQELLNLYLPVIPHFPQSFGQHIWADGVLHTMSESGQNSQRFVHSVIYLRLVRYKQGN